MPVPPSFYRWPDDTPRARAWQDGRGSVGGSLRAFRVLPRRSSTTLALLFPDDLHDHPLAAPAIELGVEDLLPRPQVQFPLGHRQHHLVMHEGALEVGVAVVLTGAVVLVVAAGGGERFHPLPEVLPEALL